MTAITGVSVSARVSSARRPLEEDRFGLVLTSLLALLTVLALVGLFTTPVLTIGVGLVGSLLIPVAVCHHIVKTAE